MTNQEVLSSGNNQTISQVQKTQSDLDKSKLNTKSKKKDSFDKFKARQDKILKKSFSRLMAVQIFFQRDFLEENFLANGYLKKNVSVELEISNLIKIKNFLIENYSLSDEESSRSYREKTDEIMLEELLCGLQKNLKEIDKEIANFLQKGWTLDRLDLEMLEILRLGAFELKFMSNTPPKVVIDEYVDITACFFDEKKIKFSNAVLDGLAKKFSAKFSSSNNNSSLILS